MTVLTLRTGRLLAAAVLAPPLAYLPALAGAGGGEGFSDGLVASGFGERLGYAVVSFGRLSYPAGAVVGLSIFLGLLRLNRLSAGAAILAGLLAGLLLGGVSWVVAAGLSDGEYMAHPSTQAAVGAVAGGICALAFSLLAGLPWTARAAKVGVEAGGVRMLVAAVLAPLLITAAPLYVETLVSGAARDAAGRIDPDSLGKQALMALSLFAPAAYFVVSVVGLAVVAALGRFGRLSGRAVTIWGGVLGVAGSAAPLAAMAGPGALGRARDLAVAVGLPATLALVTAALFAVLAGLPWTTRPAAETPG